MHVARPRIAARSSWACRRGLRPRQRGARPAGAIPLPGHGGPDRAVARRCAARAPRLRAVLARPRARARAVHPERVDVGRRSPPPCRSWRRSTPGSTALASTRSRDPRCDRSPVASTATIAVSQAAAAFVGARRAGARAGRDPERGVGVDDSRRRPRLDWPPGRRIAWAHRLDPQKGFPVLVEAFRRLASERDRPAGSASGATVPTGWRSTDCPPRCASASRCSVVLGHDEVPSLLAGADVAVAAATGQESFGIAVVEAMAAGVPVVATDIEGYREVATDGVDALLVAPGDPAALAAAIARVLDDDDLARRLGRRRHDTAAARSTGPWSTDRIEDRLPVGRSVARRYDRALMSPVIWIVLGLVVVALVRPRVALQPARAPAHTGRRRVGDDRRAAAPALRPHPEPGRDRARATPRTSASCSSGSPRRGRRRSPPAGWPTRRAPRTR